MQLLPASTGSRAFAGLGAAAKGVKSRFGNLLKAAFSLKNVLITGLGAVVARNALRAMTRYLVALALVTAVVSPGLAADLPTPNRVLDHFVVEIDSPQGNGRPVLGNCRVIAKDSHGHTLGSFGSGGYADDRSGAASA